MWKNNINIIYKPFYILCENHWVFSFPGISRDDDIIGMLQLMASKNPTNEITAKILVDGGYDFCRTFANADSLWKNSSECIHGFVTGPDNDYCYRVCQGSWPS